MFQDIFITKNGTALVCVWACRGIFSYLCDSYVFCISVPGASIASSYFPETLDSAKYKCELVPNHDVLGLLGAGRCLCPSLESHPGFGSFVPFSWRFREQTERTLTGLIHGHLAALAWAFFATFEAILRFSSLFELSASVSF